MYPAHSKQSTDSSPHSSYVILKYFIFFHTLYAFVHFLKYLLGSLFSLERLNETTICKINN